MFFGRTQDQPLDDFFFSIGRSRGVKNMQNQVNFSDFLSEAGKRYFQIIKSHASQLGIEQVDDMEMAMLANEYDLYFSNMEFCQKNGYSFVTGSNNGYSQIRPEFTVMKNAYLNILKHSGKFGMNPADRSKLFGMKSGSAKTVKKGFDLD